MVNNNYPVGIPQTYTVSYFDEAEWNKDLTVEEQKINDLVDLSYWNELISQKEGYGPCTGYYSCGDHRCSGNNACLYNERFFDLKTPCPAADCPKRQSGPSTYWYHNNYGCGNSKDKISDECRIRCPDCFNTSHMKYHKFKCAAHSNHEVQYLPTSSTSFIAAITMALNSGLPDDVFNKIMTGIKREHERSGW